MATLCRSAFLSGLLLTSAAAWAQDSGAEDSGLPDLPDASVESGGSDQTGQEGDDMGQSTTFCRETSDCHPAFSCREGRCIYQGYRDATCHGCGKGPAATLLLMLTFALRRGPKAAKKNESK